MLSKLLVLVQWVLKYAGEVDVSALFAKIKELFVFPDWASSEAVREWAEVLVDLAETAEQIGDTLLEQLGMSWLNKLDDQATVALRHVVDNDEAWAIFWALLSTLWPAPLNVYASGDIATAQRCADALNANGETKKFDPMLILQIASLLVSIIKMLTGRDDSTSA